MDILEIKKRREAMESGKLCRVSFPIVSIGHGVFTDKDQVEVWSRYLIKRVRLLRCNFFQDPRRYGPIINRWLVLVRRYAVRYHLSELQVEIGLLQDDLMEFSRGFFPVSFGNG